MRWTYRLLAMLLAIGLFCSFVPSAHADGARWIEVNLSTQTLIAYEGDTPVRTIYVSTGKPGWETPTGTFYIWKRVADETMDSETYGVPHDAPGGYYVHDVYYTQYFDDSGDALHANWWSPVDAFGNYPTSHGCVGMTTSRAAWLWNWATYGTEVWIHY